MERAVILRDKKLKKFIEEYKLECDSIIISVDDTKKEAHYTIDGIKKIESNYEIIKKYM